MSRIFQVLYIRQQPLADLLNAIRLLANPGPRKAAHITIRGPYADMASIDAIDHNLIEGTPVILQGVGRFWHVDQHTVYMNVYAPVFVSLGRRTDYPEYIPHVTLYNGTSRDVAEHVWTIVSGYQYSLGFLAGSPSLMVVGNLKGGFAEYASCSADILRLITDEECSPHLFHFFADHVRIRLIDKICRFLSRSS